MFYVTAMLLVGCVGLSKSTCVDSFGFVTTAELMPVPRDSASTTSRVRLVRTKLHSRQVHILELDDAYSGPEIFKLYVPGKSAAVHLIVVGGYGSATPISVFKIEKGAVSGKLLDESTKGNVFLETKNNSLVIVESWNTVHLKQFQGEPISKSDKGLMHERRFRFDAKSGTYKASAWNVVRYLKSGFHRQSSRHYRTSR